MYIIVHLVFQSASTLAFANSWRFFIAYNDKDCIFNLPIKPILWL